MFHFAAANPFSLRRFIRTSFPFEAPTARHPRRDATHNPLAVGVLLLVGVLGLVAALGSMMALARSECRIDRPIGPGTESEVHMTVRGGIACTVAARSVPAGDLRIVEWPQRGIVSPRGRTGVIYRPTRGLEGEDSFAFALSGPQQKGLVVRVRVTVR